MSRRPPHWPAPVYDHPLPQLLHDIGAGRAPLPTSAAKRHHYVPQLVLRGFESATKPGHVHQLDKSGATVASPIKTTAQAKRLYGGLDDAGDWNNALEGFLSLIETYAADALRFLFDTLDPPTEYEILPIPLLMALQMMRTPTALDAIGHEIERSGQNAFSFLVSDAEAFRQTYGRMHPDRSADELEALRRDTARLFAGGATLRLDDHCAAGLEMMSAILLEVAFSMAHASWWVLRSDEVEFVTNDVGFARCTPGDDVAIPQGVVFPFRSDRCIVVTAPNSPTDGTITRSTATKRVVRHVNLRMYGWSNRFIFGSSQNSLQQVRAAAKAQPRRARSPAAHEWRPMPPGAS